MGQQRSVVVRAADNSSSPSLEQQTITTNHHHDEAAAQLLPSTTTTIINTTAAIVTTNTRTSTSIPIPNNDALLISDRIRRKTIARLKNSKKIENARRAAIMASDRAWTSIIGMHIINDNDNNNNNNNMDNNNNTAQQQQQLLYFANADDDDDDQHSLLSSNDGTSTWTTQDENERATLRGVQRGSQELGEEPLSRRGGGGGLLLFGTGSSSYNDKRHHYHSDHFNTIGGDSYEHAMSILLEQQQSHHHHHTTGCGSGSTSLTRGGRNDHDDHDDNGDGCEGWMCGVCGLAFSSHDMCERHEVQHIAQVVAGMEWNKVDKSGTTTRCCTTNSAMKRTMNNNTTNGPILPDRQRRQRDETNPSVKSILRPQQHTVTFGKSDTVIPISPTTAAAAAAAAMTPLSTAPPIQEEEEEEEKISDEGDDGSYEDDVLREFYGERKREREAGSRSRDHNHQARTEEEADLLLPSTDSSMLVPRPRSRSTEVRFAEDTLLGVHTTTRPPPPPPLHHHHDDFDEEPSRSSGTSNNYQDDHALLLSNRMKDYVVLADEALLDVLSRAEPMILSPAEVQAERELALLARDKEFYDELQHRAAARRSNPTNRFRSDEEHLMGKVQNKFLDAYQLMKESDGKKGISDQYNRKMKSGQEESPSIKHTDRTLYVNVMVKNGVQVVRHELERLAKQRWEVAEKAESFTRFERFRVYTQMNMVKLAGIALASDFTPRRIAVQLSNDLYRLLTPRLKRRGVTIETEIEYRVGPYFVLAVNINTIDWYKLIRATQRDVAQRNARWAKEHEEDDSENKKGFLSRKLDYLKSLRNISWFDAIAYTMAFLYMFHWTIYLPICWLAYNTGLGTSIRQFILASVADEIFFYVEEKGMEMDIRVCRTEKQASFMLSALREIRADGQELKKKRKASEAQEKGPILGPLMGPAIPADKGPAVVPEGFEVPPNLEFVGLELDLPVGFQRMRWAFLSKRSEFIREALYKTEARYDDIVMGDWNEHNEYIGEPKLPDGVKAEDFIGAEMEGEYLMPKSAFVSANMCYETHFILAYNDYCFCLKKRARNPDAPFGKTFIAWTQYTVVNTGNNTCKLTCSVEAEFPNGEPMVSRQIRSGMRAGTGELFVLIGETVEKYADEFP